MFVIGITGGIGSGKSLAAKACREYGLPVIDADQISKELTGPEGKAIPEISEMFGKKMIASDGSLNRKEMSDLVFKSKKSLDVLGSIIHKYVVEEMKKQVLELSEQKIKAIALDVPIPVKNGFIDISDQIWVISANEDIRIERLKNRGMDPAEAKRRILCQMSEEEYEKIADIVITNNEDIQHFKNKITKILDKELGSRGIKFKNTKN